MGLFSIINTAGDFKRLRRIVGVIFEAGGEILLEDIRLKYLVPVRVRLKRALKRPDEARKLITEEGGRRVISKVVLREVLEKLGPTFTKLGQVLSLRADVIGEEMSKELSKLQSEVKPFSYAEVRKIITEDLGKSPERLFKSFEAKPIAAASLAQVHKAKLHDGTEVAIKVQRPDIRGTIEKDIHILLYLAHLVESFVPELAKFQPVRVVKEFADWTMRELDFVIEGRNADRFRYIYRDNPKIGIPLIYWDYTSKRVLTMEFIHGVKADDRRGMKRLGADAKQLALDGAEAFFQQFLVEGFFHADPHPGNFFVGADNVLWLADFGMVGYLNKEQRKELISCYAAFIDKDSDAFAKHSLHLANVDAKSDTEGFQRDVAAVLSEFFYSEKQPSVAWAFYRALNKGVHRGVGFPADLALLAKALVTAEGMSLKLYPQFNFSRELEPAIRKAMIMYLSPQRALNELKTDVFDYLEFFKTLPERTQALVEKIDKGEVGVKIDTGDLFGLKKEFDRQNDVRILGIVLVAVFFTTLALMYNEGIRTIYGVPMSDFGLGLFFLLLIWFVFKVRKGPE